MGKEGEEKRGIYMVLSGNENDNICTVERQRRKKQTDKPIQNAVSYDTKEGMSVPNSSASSDIYVIELTFE